MSRLALVVVSLLAGAALFVWAVRVFDGPEPTSPSSTAGQPAPPAASPQSSAEATRPPAFSLRYSASSPEVHRGLTSADVTMDVVVAVTNEGETEARNVRLVVQALTEGTVVPINDEPQLQVPLGTIQAHETREAVIPIRVHLTIATGTSVLRSGIELNVDVLSEERSQRFSFKCTREEGCSPQ